VKVCSICDLVGGPLVTCSECGRPKAPIGRSVAPAAVSGYCDGQCPGYRRLPPHPDQLWPGERWGDVYGHSAWHEEQG